MKRTEIKHKAQDALMQGIANQLGYYDPADFGENLSESEREELRAEMKRQADRVAKLFGYEEAWSG